MFLVSAMLIVVLLRSTKRCCDQFSDLRVRMEPANVAIDGGSSDWRRQKIEIKLQEGYVQLLE